MKIIDRIKGAFRKLGADTKITKEYKDVFELGGVPAFNQFYNYGIFIWKYIYKGFYNAWHLVNEPTIANPRNKRELFRTDIAKAACAELAGLLWGEKCTINLTRKNFTPSDEEPDDIAERFIYHVLSENNFTTKMQELIEQALALGGAALKVWHEEKRDDDGEPISGAGKIRVGYCMADQFIPTAWDNAGINEGIFISRIAKNGYYYTRLEKHEWDGTTYVVSNELYRSGMKTQSNESQDILGFRYPLAAVYPFLDEQTKITALEYSLFSYFRTPIANNLDDNSPLGVSIYANALSTLRALDICYDSFVREFRLGKKRIIVPARCIRTVVDPTTQETRRYFDATDETYEALATDDINDLKIYDNSVSLRVEEHVAALNAFLQILCLQLGFSASTFSFDIKGGLKTATEVISENSKTFKTVKNCQNAIAPAIERLVHNIFAVAVLYDVEFEGQKVASWFSDDKPLREQYDCSIYWDDGVVQDRQTNINEGILLTTNGLMSKKRFLTETLGMTDAQAEAEIAAINDESRITGLTVDRFTTFTG